jgi:hypothetical protein
MLLYRIRRFCETTGLPQTKFGRLAVNDPRLVGDLARGRVVGPHIVARCERLMAEHRA